MSDLTREIELRIEMQSNNLSVTLFVRGRHFVFDSIDIFDGMVCTRSFD